MTDTIDTGALDPEFVAHLRQLAAEPDGYGVHISINPADARAILDAADRLAALEEELVDLRHGAGVANTTITALEAENRGLQEALRGMLDLDEEHHQRGLGDEDVCQEVQRARIALAGGAA